MNYVVRPATPADLGALMRLAAESVPALTNLPAHRERLGARLEQSVADLAAPVDTPGAEFYVFVLEATDDDGRAKVVGTASLRACTGAREAYYTWRRETLIHASQQLDVRREVAVLSLSHELSASTLLCGFSLRPSYRDTPAATLLRHARLLFAALHPERFADWLAVAFTGHIDANGCYPFWEAVGRRFFARDFEAINQIAGTHSKSFIAEVMPPFPLYEPLMSAPGRAAIGSIHPAHGSAAAELRAEGFTRSRHIDLFDGGQLLEADFDRLHCVRYSRWHPVRVADAPGAPGAPAALIANQRSRGFRCVSAPRALGRTDQIVLAAERAAALAVEPGHAVLAAPLDHLADAAS